MLALVGKTPSHKGWPLIIEGITSKVPIRVLIILSKIRSRVLSFLGWPYLTLAQSNRFVTVPESTGFKRFSVFFFSFFSGSGGKALRRERANETGWDGLGQLTTGPLEGKETEEKDTADNETNRLRRFPLTDDRPLGTWGGSRRDRERRENIKRRRCVS